MSLIIILTLLLLYLANVLLTKSQNASNMYIGKVFFTVLMCFVVVPAVIILKNDNIVRHAMQEFSNSKFFKIWTDFHDYLTGMCKNKVSPFLVDENLQV